MQHLIDHDEQELRKWGLNLWIIHTQLGEEKEKMANRQIAKKSFNLARVRSNLKNTQLARAKEVKELEKQFSDIVKKRVDDGQKEKVYVKDLQI